MVQGLVDYTDSEDETEAPLPKLPPLSMGDEGYKNEWLSFVYVPVPYSLSGLPSLLEKVVAHSHDLMLAYDHMDHEPSLHVSLTRPIILRKHEERSFAEEVLQAVKSLSLPRFSLAFSRFICLPSDSSERVFLCMELSAGWHELYALVQELNPRFQRLFGARGYYDKAQFHASVAFMDDVSVPRQQLIRHGHTLAEALNDALGQELCRVGPLHVSVLAARVGQHVHNIYLAG
ncbi:Hypothetical protein MSYG_3944 [Malassezia sympodialis ATCC 42132]|uniref:U6 snRNA phosphodiesterase 1 n=1 Tax=Malassezia sympodialis (strain ATCC 42132) TaxID=1230383 RepID=A0A1M8ABM4_MALS4|nr:Hypothetical protein MSYG_3944 [Malassezia sympodialis ATCC 42132]